MSEFLANNEPLYTLFKIQTAENLQNFFKNVLSEKNSSEVAHMTVTLKHAIQHTLNSVHCSLLLQYWTLIYTNMQYSHTCEEKKTAHLVKNWIPF